MRGRPPKKTLSPEQARAADAFVGGAEAPSSGSGRTDSSSTPGVEAKPEIQPKDTVPPAPTKRVRQRRTETNENPTRPWEADYVREDVVKGYALRLPEPLYLKMKWVAAERGQSMNELIQKAVADVVEDHLRNAP
ncbi:MAG: hypothetical protein SangKO_099040 [Sandaracinaceae bacterium]